MKKKNLKCKIRCHYLSFHFLKENYNFIFDRNASIQLSNKFYLSPKQIFINNLRYEPKDSVIVDFSIFGSDYSNITQFYSLIDSIYNQISNKRLTIEFNSKQYILNLSTF
jgi:hypothetical protein